MGHWNTSILSGFNTQPPEGGWRTDRLLTLLLTCFNTQPPEGGWFNRHNIAFHY